MMPAEPLPQAPTVAAAFAQSYAAIGWRSFPVKHGEKRPAYSGWQADATVDPAMVDQYWRVEPARNVGLVTGELFDVFDIEGPHLARLLDWMLRNGHVLPETPIASTARGGRHIYTALTGVDQTRKLHLEGVHIGELKSRGGLVVAPPSVVTVDGKRGAYSWMWAPAGMALAEPPAWMLSLLEPVRARRFVAAVTSIEEGERRLDILAASVREREEGSRNSYLYWATRRAIEEGMPGAIVGSYMAAVGTEVGLPAAEAERTVESAITAALAAQGVDDAAD